MTSLIVFGEVDVKWFRGVEEKNNKKLSKVRHHLGEVSFYP